ncbi:gliding motility lipoprotein GldH [uncultured Bacteroides sp.]|uniref:gliding motility lipoprotein GldH n=1 Tax=uncultured Bacteroides sp. TaxID=162156 RepID=UPI00262722A0|nr:gliding motility lipoprotein GldH [uncultured Bacteroides sp.]
MNRIPLKYFYIIGITLFLSGISTACTDGNTAYYHYEAVKGLDWEKSDTLTFTIPDSITGQTYNLEIGIRHNELYPYQDIWMELIHGVSPDKSIQRLHIQLADEKGNWNGSGNSGSLYQHITKEAEISLLPGDSVLRLVHIMRHNPLPGISDVGIRLSFPSSINPKKHK